MKLACAWLAATENGNWEQGEYFACLLYEECRLHLGRGALKGLMAGMESEVSQEALTMLFSSFLRRNERLHNATDHKNLSEIENSLRWSIRRCLRIAISRIARIKKREAERVVQGIDLDALESALHPRLRKYGDLTCDERCAMALAALQLAVQHRLLSAKNAKVTRMILEEGINPRNAAKRMGVSPRAINQQLVRVAAKLSILKDAVEISQP